MSEKKLKSKVFDDVISEFAKAVFPFRNTMQSYWKDPTRKGSPLETSSDS